MRKFRRQNTLWDCGPTALFNMLRWTNKDILWAARRNLIKLCETDKSGTFSHNMAMALNELCKGKDITWAAAYNIETLIEGLNGGRGAIVGFLWPNALRHKFGGHYFFCYKNGDLFYCVNLRWWGNTVECLTESLLRFLLSESGDELEMFLIKKAAA